MNLVDLISQTMFGGGVGEAIRRKTPGAREASASVSAAMTASLTPTEALARISDSPDSDPDSDAGASDGDGAGSNGETSAQYNPPIQGLLWRRALI